MSEQWISASEALRKIEASSSGGANRVICRRARDGMAIAKAKLLIWGRERREDTEIPAMFWWAGGEAALEQNWYAGDFSTWIDSSIECRAYGVTFRASDIDDMLPRTSSRLPVSDGAPGNFSSSARAVSEICAQVGCDGVVAIQEIVKHCRAGFITGRCSEISWRITDRYATSEEFFEHMVDVPDWFWEHCANQPETIIDWQSGKVSGRGIIDGNDYRVLIKGLQFEVAGIIDLEAMMLAELPPPDISVESSSGKEREGSVNRGRKRDPVKWADWTAELVAHIHENGIPEGCDADGQDHLIDEIDSRLIERGQNGLSRTTVQPIVRAVLLRLRSAGN